MKLAYRCQNCGAQNEIPCPAKDATVEELLESLLPLKFQTMNPRFLVAPWVRHPCAVGTSGIAQLVAIIED